MLHCGKLRLRVWSERHMSGKRGCHFLSICAQGLIRAELKKDAPNMAKITPKSATSRRIRARSLFVPAGVLVGGCAGLTPALAQDSDPFRSIEDRFRPQYTTPPINVGGLEVSPRIEVDMEAIDNVFASEMNDRSDVTVSLQPAVSIRDRRSDRQLSLNARATVETYLNNSFSDRVLINTNGRARFGLNTRTRPFLGFNFRQNDTRRSDFIDLTNTAQPVQLTSLGANGGIEQEFGALTTTLEGRYNNTSFNDEVVADVDTTSSSPSDFDILSARLRIAYSVNPSHQIYIESDINDRNYEADASDPTGNTDPFADRTSDGFTVRAGTQLRLSEILRLDVSAGFLQQDFENEAFDSISSYSFDVGLFYSPSQLTRMRFSASRAIDDTVNPFFNGFLTTEFGIGVEHELLRNLIISTEGVYRIIATNDSTSSAQSDSEEFQVSGRLRLFISEQWSLRTRATYFERDPLFGGSQFRGLVGLAYSF